jgi:YbbR domain-containing protein
MTTRGTKVVKKKFNLRLFLKTLRSRLFDDFRVKLLALILAITMYVLIGVIQRNTETYAVPIQVRGLPEFLVVASEMPETAKIVVRDKQKVLSGLTVEEFDLHLDLSGIPNPTLPGTETVRVKWTIPPSLKSFFSTVSVEPREIELMVDRIAEKNVRLEISTTGTLSEGYVVENVDLNPSFVRVQGPEHIVGAIDSLATETISLEGEFQSFRRSVRILNPSTAVKVIGTGKAEVSYEIGEVQERATYSLRRLGIKNLKRQFRAYSIGPALSLTIEGAADDLADVSADLIELSVDCSQVIFPGDYTLQVEVKLPENVRLVAVKPASQRIRVVDRDQ